MHHFSIIRRLSLSLSLGDPRASRLQSAVGPANAPETRRRGKWNWLRVGPLGKCSGVTWLTRSGPGLARPCPQLATGVPRLADAMISLREPVKSSSISHRAGLFPTRLHSNSYVCTMASPIIRMQTRRLGSQLRSFSTSPRQYAPVNKLGVIGSGQMVSAVTLHGGLDGVFLTTTRASVLRWLLPGRPRCP